MTYFVYVIKANVNYPQQHIQADIAPSVKPGL